MNIKNCEKCGKIMKKTKNHSLKYWMSRKFCSNNCINKGRKQSKETKNKRSLMFKKLWENPEYRKKVISNRKGMKNVLGKRWKLSEITIKKHTGKLNPAWKGGITPENTKIRNSIQFSLWREAVFARDNWTCQKTKKRGVKLHAHHIQNFAQCPELRFAIDNGITLSEDSHNQFHKKYGRKNNNKQQINEFLTIPI